MIVLLFDAEHTIAAKASQPAQATAYEPKTPPVLEIAPDRCQPCIALAVGTRPAATRAQLGKSRGIDAGFKLRDVALIARASEKFIGGADASELASVLPADIPPLNSTSASGSGR
jgi:hypothetical protein